MDNNFDFYKITDMDKYNCQYPNITVTEEKKVFLTWQQHKGKTDKIVVGEFLDEKIVNKKVLSTGLGLTPVNHFFNNTLWTAWTEYKNDKWSIVINFSNGEEYSDNIIVSEDEALFYPYLTDDGENIILLWNSQKAGESKIIVGKLNQNGIISKEVINTQTKVYRPTACTDDNGNLYVAYDTFNGKNYDIFVVSKSKEKWSEPKKISSSTDWNSRPIINNNKNKCTVFWYEFGRGAKFSYKYCDINIDNGVISPMEDKTISSGVNWYQDISMTANNKGTQAIAYTWGKDEIHLRYRKNDEEWSLPVMASYGDDSPAVHPNIFLDNDDCVHVSWQSSNTNGHYDRNAQIIYNKIPIEKAKDLQDERLDTKTSAFTMPIKQEKEILTKATEEEKTWLQENNYGKIVFGDIHGQSGISDGVGEIDQFYHFAEVSANLDFTALTDHDCYPDWLSQSEWEWIRTSCRLVNEEKNISALLSYEWTSNEYKYDFGHKNVYYRGNDGDVFRSGEVEGMTPFKLFESVKKYKGMAFPHHPAALWDKVSSATDWNFHDEEVQRVVEIFSRHAPFEYYGNTSIYTKNVRQAENLSAQDALKRGYKLGFIGGSDSHQMEHGIEGGVLAAFVENNTRESIFDAIYNRHVYATTGARILVSFKINDAPMGSEIKNTNNEANIKVSVVGTKSLTVEIIKNNEVILKKESDENKCCFVHVDRIEKPSYYYIRVTQKDSHQAWSSPIWVE